MRVPREEIFVTSKVAAEAKTYEETAKSIDESLEKMGLDDIDMMIIHSPQPWADFRGGDYAQGNREAWEDAYDAGKLKVIGVSNFRQEEGRWECDSEGTGKRLARLLFYQYMLEKNTIFTATYRDEVVGVVLTAGKRRAAPIYRVKKGYTFLRLKMTKEGRENLKFLDQIRNMQEKLEQEAGGERYFLRVFYVKKKYRRNGAGTGLLNCLEETEKNNLYACARPGGQSGFSGKAWICETKL